MIANAPHGQPEPFDKAGDLLVRQSGGAAINYATTTTPVSIQVEEMPRRHTPSGERRAAPLRSRFHALDMRGYSTMVAVYLFFDSAALLLAFELALIVRILLGADIDFVFYVERFPLLLGLLGVYWMVSLYPAAGISPAEQLRRLTLCTSGMFVVLAASTYIAKSGELYSRGIFFIALLFALILVPLLRFWARSLSAKRPAWGVPVAILGAGNTGNRIIHLLRSQPEYGLRPVIVLDDEPAKHGTFCGLPVPGGLDLAPALVKETDIRHAIVAMPGVPCDRLLALLEKHANTFRHLIVVPDLFGFSSVCSPSRDLGGVLGLEMQQRLLMPGHMASKRAMDLLVILLCAPFVLPLVALLALLVKLDSRGPVFFRQRRLGWNGVHLDALKFRSMVEGAEELLQKLLREDPALREEYQTYHKLRCDPRLTRVGRFLRKWSLDELPQLWNVVRGEMSLVGPRAYLPREMPEMHGHAGFIGRVRPGITGLWQVSGRNEVGFDGRLELDISYVRNWSPWLDTHILARTVLVVLSRKGAY
jgi:Undecaprenyl-phosphate galactose phosphotransferase WbaP